MVSYLPCHCICLKETYAASERRAAHAKCAMGLRTDRSAPSKVRSNPDAAKSW